MGQATMDWYISQGIRWISRQYGMWNLIWMARLENRDQESDINLTQGL
jgi:hypothetical protein